MVPPPLDDAFPSHEVFRPSEQTAPVVFASPHSGSDYPPDFVAASRLDPIGLRRSEDAFIDILFAAVPQFGAPLLRARFPRAYVDPNRDAFELDPGMFADVLPDYVDAGSPRVAAGLGTIAKVVANGETIYRGKLPFAEALKRIETCYRPYHQALDDLLEATRQRFGCCLLVDCHSMPSVGGPYDRDQGDSRVDVVLGDRHGTACAPAVVDMAERALASAGLAVRRNVPFAGGFITRHHGRPAEGRHAMQIEINRRLYMDERTVRATAELPVLARRLASLIRVLTRIAPEELAAS